MCLCFTSLWPSPLTYWPENQYISSMGHGQLRFQVIERTPILCSKVTVTLTFNRQTSISIGIFYGSWPTKTPIMVSLNLVRFNVMSGQWLYAPGHCDLDLDVWPTNPKEKGIIYGSWPSMISRKVYQNETRAIAVSDSYPHHCAL